MKKKGQAEFTQWMGPLLDCLRTVGGSAKPREVSDWIAREHKLPISVVDAVMKSGEQRFHNQVQWARMYLVWEGLLDKGRRGLWTLSAKGWNTKLTPEDSRLLFLKWVAIHQDVRKAGSPVIETETSQTKSKNQTVSDIPLSADEIEEQGLLSVLRGLPSYGFERVCQRLLRESGFEDVVVTQRSHDGGIDGYGVLRLNPFVSIKVAFQCKRYKGSVGRAAVGDFRNAMLGRAEKGIILTTGNFTRDAIVEASRDGAPPIELVDRDRLVEMFENLQLGLTPRQVFEIDQSFFDQFRNE